jgi:hypothetical protein
LRVFGPLIVSRELNGDLATQIEMNSEPDRSHTALRELTLKAVLVC